MRKYAPPVVSLSTRPQEQDCLEQSQTHQSYHYLSALSHSTSPQDIGVQIYSSAFENWSSFVRFYSLVKLYSRTDRYPYFTHSRGKQSSLRSKRFQSSYCAKVGAEAKKKVEGGGGGEKRKPSPSPVIHFFLLLSQLSRRTSRGNACYAGYKQRRLIQVCACRLVFPGCVVTYLNFDSMSMREVIDDLNVVNSLVINREL